MSVFLLCVKYSNLPRLHKNICLKIFIEADKIYEYGIYIEGYARCNYKSIIKYASIKNNIDFINKINKRKSKKFKYICMSGNFKIFKLVFSAVPKTKRKKYLAIAYKYSTGMPIYKYLKKHTTLRELFLPMALINGYTKIYTKIINNGVLWFRYYSYVFKYYREDLYDLVIAKMNHPTLNKILYYICAGGDTAKSREFIIKYKCKNIIWAVFGACRSANIDLFIWCGGAGYDIEQIGKYVIWSKNIQFIKYIFELYGIAPHKYIIDHSDSLKVFKYFITTELTLKELAHIYETCKPSIVKHYYIIYKYINMGAAVANSYQVIKIFLDVFPIEDLLVYLLDISNTDLFQYFMRRASTNTQNKLKVKAILCDKIHMLEMHTEKKKCIIF